MNKEDIVRMALEAGFEQLGPDIEDWVCFTEELERFAALVEAHVNAKEKERQRYDLHSCGPTCDRHICVAVRNEREACAKTVEQCDWPKWAERVDEREVFAAAIRARGQQ